MGTYDPLVDGDPTDEERAAVEQAWRRGELLPPPWVVVKLPAGPTAEGTVIPPGTYVMLKAPEVWAEQFASEMNLDQSHLAKDLERRNDTQ
jgi:hypothetical protein